jgi:3-deoxy-D-manno-octulosonic-acid transferase
MWQAGPPAGIAVIFKRWASSALIGLYNIAMVMGGMLLLPLIVPLMATSKKRLLTFKRRLWCHPIAPGRDRGRSDKPLWVHALSVGEVFAAQPLIRQIQSHYPHLPIVLTVSTLTGFQTAPQLLEGQRCAHHLFSLRLDSVSKKGRIATKPLGCYFH